MGYRSDVVIVIAFDQNDELVNFMSPRLLKEELRYLKKYCRFYEGKSYCVIELYGTKWYEDSEEVNPIIELMDEAVEEWGGYRFLRIGEDIEDMEDRCEDTNLVNKHFLWNKVGIVRSIEVNV